MIFHLFLMTNTERMSTVSLPSKNVFLSLKRLDGVGDGGGRGGGRGRGLYIVTKPQVVCYLWGHFCV